MKESSGKLALILASAMFSLASPAWDSEGVCAEPRSLLREQPQLKKGELFSESGKPAPPRLIAPVDSATITGPGIVLSWEPGRLPPQPTSYRVCIAEEGQPCTGGRAWNYPGVGQAPLTGTTLLANLPASLYQGKRLAWTVAACAPNRIQAKDRAAETCTYATPRALIWPLPPPVLGQPDDRTQLTGLRPPFSVRPVDGAETYLFCISKPGAACPSTAAWDQNTVVAQVSSYPSSSWNPGRDLAQFAGQTVNWTAAACNRASGCVYQQNTRTLSFPPTMAKVYIRLHSQFDVDQLWVARGGGPGTPRIEEVFVRDLIPFRNPLSSGSRSTYETELAVQIPKRHGPAEEPNVTPYYGIEYMMEQAGSIGGNPALPYRKVYGVPFAPGVRHVPGYSLVRETIFIFDYSGFPNSRHEQLLRGPDGRLYIYRPGENIAGGPIPLDRLIREGYRMYTPQQLGP